MTSHRTMTLFHFATLLSVALVAACESDAPPPADDAMTLVDTTATEDRPEPGDITPAEDVTLDTPEPADVPAPEDRGAPDVFVTPDVSIAPDVQDVPPVRDVPVPRDTPDASTADVPRDAPSTTAPNANCAMATRLSGTARLTGENLARALGTPSTASCGGGDRLFYAINVPAASSILVTVTPTGTQGWDPYIRVLDACMDTLPLCSRVAARAGVAAPERLRYVNTVSSGSTGMPIAHDVIIAVGASGAAVGTFDLDVRVDPPDPNATCAGALPLPVDGSSVMADLGHGQATGTLCMGGLTGVPTLYYRATVPPGSELIATMTPTGTPLSDVELFAYTACSTTCTGRIDTGGEGSAEAIVVPNNGTSPQTVYLGASADGSSPLGTFTLTGLVTPQDYATTSISAACDGGIASIGHYTTVNQVSPVRALPFPFTFYGAAMSGYGVSTNGFALLLPTTTGTVSATPVNRTFPLTEGPNGVIAPFWDALAPRPTFGSELRAGVVGTAPNRRFVIEWDDWGLVEDPTTRLRFQAKLFETTRVIELHYCSLAMGTMTDLQTGRHATLGIENPAGTRGVLIGANNRRVVASGAAIRMTPR